MFFLKRSLVFLALVSAIVFASCRSEGVCSGLNPEIGKYNTSKRLSKGGKGLKSKPERDSLHRRKRMLKKKGEFSSKGRYSGGIHIFGGGFSARGSASANVNVQQKN